MWQSKRGLINSSIIYLNICINVRLVVCVQQQKMPSIEYVSRTIQVGRAQ